METTGRWIVGTVVTVGLLIAALGGPEDAWLKIESAVAGHRPPKIISVEPSAESSEGTYIVTIRNPALQDVAITGYRTGPVQFSDLPLSSGMENATADLNTAAGGGGEAVLVEPVEPKPDHCSGKRLIKTARPLVIEPKRIAALQIRPWSEWGCWFSIAVLSDHGVSEPRDGPLGQ